MAWGMAAQAGIEIANSIFNRASDTSGKASARQFAYNLALQQQAQAWNEKMYQHRYQWQVDDLEKAGINKLYGLGTAPSPTSGLNNVGMEDDQGNENKRKELGLEALGLTSEISARQAQTKLTENQAKTELINANLKQQEVLGAQLDNIQKQMQNKATPERVKLELKNEQARLNNQMKDLQVKNQQIIESNQNIGIAKYNATTGRMSANSNTQIGMMNARANQMTAKSQSWRNYNQSLGYNTTIKGGPVLFSHTGNPNAYTRNNGQNARYVTENINGHKVKVRVYK